MTAILVGGMDRLKPQYVKEARKAGVKLKVFTGKERKIGNRIGAAEYIVMFTDKLSHKAKQEVLQSIKNKDIPVFQFHSSGISTLRECLHNSCSLN